MASGPVFMFCALGLVWGGNVGAGYRFHVLLSRTYLGRYQGRRVPISWFALPDSISAEPRAPVPIFMFCAARIVWGGIEGVRSCFQVLRSHIFFSCTEGVRSLFQVCTSQLVLGVTRVSGPVFMLCSPRLVLGGTEGGGSNFHVLHSRTHFRRYRGHRAPFSCFALPDSFSVVPRASGPVFVVSAP
jgi:hypothetical protein